MQTNDPVIVSVHDDHAYELPTLRAVFGPHPIRIGPHQSLRGRVEATMSKVQESGKQIFCYECYSNVHDNERGQHWGGTRGKASVHVEYMFEA